MPSDRRSRKDSDEAYVIGLCDFVLTDTAVPQAKFDYLRGDSRQVSGKGRQLPVDAFYPKLNLVIEYHELQHSQPVAIMDRRMTVSGVSRGEQRKIYDERRRRVLPQQGFKILILSYSDFECSLHGRLKRNREQDVLVIRRKLRSFVGAGTK